VIEVSDRLKGRDFTSVRPFSRADLEEILDLADALKVARAAYEPTDLLPRRTIALIFQKPSTRTRVSFEAGVAELGGTAIHLATADMQLGRGESIRDTAYVLSRYLDGIMIRTFAQADVDELAEHASIPVVNGLTDEEHPCQALADVMTIRERFGSVQGVRVAYVGDGNNVCVSLMQACAALGAEFVAATPPGHGPAPGAVDGASVTLVGDPREAASGAHVLYTDVWTSMGQEAERDERRRVFRDYAITPELLALAAPDAIVLHCLPAHPGEEIAEEVLYGPQSAVWDQAENRLHAEKALLALIVP
jgi:ornithine carbamoyltransferase